MEVKQPATPTIPERGQVTAGPKKKKALSQKSLERIKSLAPLAALLVLSLLIGSQNPRFFDFFNFVRIANSAAIPLVLGLGATFVILLGSVDLSVEGVLALGAVVVAILVHNDMNQNSFGWLAPLVLEDLRRRMDASRTVLLMPPSEPISEQTKPAHAIVRNENTSFAPSGPDGNSNGRTSA